MATMKKVFFEMINEIEINNYACALFDNETFEIFYFKDEVLFYPYYDREIAVNKIFKQIQEMLFDETDFSIYEVEKQIDNDRYLLFMNSKYSFDIISKAEKIDLFFTEQNQFFINNGFCFDEAIEKTEFTAKMILSCDNDFFVIDTE